MVVALLCAVSIFFFNGSATTEIYPLSLHDALPIFGGGGGCVCACVWVCVWVCVFELHILHIFVPCVSLYCTVCVCVCILMSVCVSCVFLSWHTCVIPSQVEVQHKQTKELEQGS